MEIKSNDGKNIHFEVTGTGPSIILIHGFGLDSSIWKKSGWIDHLKCQYTVASFDLRGCGRSDKANEIEDHTIENYINDIDSIITMLNDQQPILWGWSLGATIALLYGKERSTKGIIACGTYFGEIFSDSFVKNRLSLMTSLQDRSRLLAFQKWPIVYPYEIKKPFLIYTGSKDGNVVIQLTKQAEDIKNANGKVQIYDELDHFGLITELGIIKNDIDSFLVNILRNKA